MNSMNKAGIGNTIEWSDNTDLNKGYSKEPNEIQKSVDQIGLDAVIGIVRPHGSLKFCDMHGYYAVQGNKQMNEDGTEEISTETCPLCTVHSQEGEGTRASEVELFIDLRDSLNNATTIID